MGFWEPKKDFIVEFYNDRIPALARKEERIFKHRKHYVIENWEEILKRGTEIEQQYMEKFRGPNKEEDIIEKFGEEGKEVISYWKEDMERLKLARTMTKEEVEFERFKTSEDLERKKLIYRSLKVGEFERDYEIRDNEWSVFCDDLQMEGLSILEKGGYSRKVISLVEKILSEFPDNEEAKIMLKYSYGYYGFELIRNGLTAEAINKLTLAIDKFDEFNSREDLLNFIAEAFIKRAHCYYKENYFLKAINDCEEAVNLKPEELRFHRFLALLYTETSLFSKHTEDSSAFDYCLMAISELEECFRLDDNEDMYDSYSFNLFRCFMQISKIKEEKLSFKDGLSRYIAEDIQKKAMIGFKKAEKAFIDIYGKHKKE